LKGGKSLLITFFYLKILINMIYKEKVINLLDVLNAKIRIIENVSNGSMRLSQTEVNQLIKDTKEVTERISEIISIER
jgi:hypothetical protein